MAISIKTTLKAETKLFDIRAIVFLEATKCVSVSQVRQKIPVGFCPINMKITYMLKICHPLLIFLLCFLFFQWLNGIAL